MHSSMDLNTGLYEMVDSSCGLTGACTGVITTIDDPCRLVGFLAPNLSAEEVRALVAWPDGPMLFEHRRDIDQPFNLPDLPGYFESHGFSPGPPPRARC